MDQIIDTNTEAMKLLQILKPNDIIAFDLETTGLNVRKEQVTDIALYDGKTAYNIVHRKWNGTELEEVVSKQVCALILNKLKKCKLRTWNGSFDTRFVYHYFGINLIESIWEDGMLKAHLAEENRFSYGLKEIAADVYGENATAEKTDMLQSIKANGGTAKQYFMADSNIRAKYAMQDVKLTYSLCEHFQEQLAADGLEEFYQLETMELYRHVTIYAELYGIPVDVPFMQTTQAELSGLLIELEEQIQAEIAPLLNSFNSWYMNKNYPFELNSKFKQKLGELIAPELWPRLESGKLSFNAADLKRAKELTKTEIKKGVSRPLLQESDFENYISGKIRMPSELVYKVQRALMEEDGIKHIFNLSSKDHLKRLFFGTSTVESVLKEIPISTTDKGSPQVDDEFLSAMALKYDWVKKLQRLNSLNKIKSTYVDRFLEEQENGIFYPSFYQHRTTSGRYSGDFQQLPRIKNEEEEPDEVVREFTSRIRNFFIAGVGKKFVDADYSSLEVVVFADDAEDEPLLNIIKNKEDFYSRLAILVYDLPEYSADKSSPVFLKKHRPEIRQAAKAFALGIRYGLGEYKLHKDLNITQQEAKRIVDSYFSSFPKLKSRMDDLQDSARRLGYVKSKAGRIRHLPEIPKIIDKWGECILNGLDLWKEWNEYPEQYEAAKRDARVLNNLLNNALNFPIQSFAASIVNRASIRLSKQFRKDGINAYIAANVHDEILVRCDENCVDIVKQYMREYMENTTTLLVPLEAEPIVGDRYGEVK